MSMKTSARIMSISAGTSAGMRRVLFHEARRCLFAYVHPSPSRYGAQRSKYMFTFSEKVVPMRWANIGCREGNETWATTPIYSYHLH